MAAYEKGCDNMENEHKTQSEINKGKLKILVAIDASQIGELVLKRSGQYAKVTDCDLTILHVLDAVVTYGFMPDSLAHRTMEEEANRIVEQAKKALEHHGIKCKTNIAIGAVASEIVRIADEGEFDVIFVGSRGYGGIKRMLLGSVADNVIRHAHCSVTVIR